MSAYFTPSYKLLKDLSIVEGKESDEINKLYRSAVDNFDLSIADYLTIRDLLRISGYNNLPLHAILILMFVSMNEGSVCLRLNKKTILEKLKGLVDSNANNFTQDIITGIKNFPELIYDHNENSKIKNLTEQFKPVILVHENKDSFLYFQKYYANEKRLKSNLNALLNVKIDYHKNMITDILDDILVKNPVYFNNKPALFNIEQSLALVLSLVNNFVIISGGPGTGKTSIIINLIRALLRTGILLERIKIAAPTGRATMRITDAIHNGFNSIKKSNKNDIGLEQINASTIHRLLRYSTKINSFLYNSKNKIPADVIIIDEVSMVDVVMMGKLFEAVDQGVKIIFLGDKNQLPSVDAGAVLSDMIPHDGLTGYSKEILEYLSHDKAEDLKDRTTDTRGPLTDRVVVLQKNFRSEKKISEIARKVNSEDESVIDKIPILMIESGERLNIDWPQFTSTGTIDQVSESGVWLIEMGISDMNSGHEFFAILESWTDQHYYRNNEDIETYESLIKLAGEYSLSNNIDEKLHPLLTDIFLYLDKGRILTPVRSGKYGTGWINKYLSGIFKERLDPGADNNIFSGAPVIITRNDYSKGLFNGDVGVVLKDKNKKYSAIFHKSDSFTVHPIELLPAYELAFAITVHKSQGSEYDNVLFVVSNDITEKLLTKEIIYTGLTRAKNSVIIYANNETLKKAVNCKMERESGIKFV